jgi:anti-sigma B factor antagonist
MNNGQTSEALEVYVIPDRDRVIVAPRGEIDLATVERVRERLHDLEAVGFNVIVLDLRNVTFIDSTGVKLVLEEVKKDGIDFAVIPGPRQVQRIFELTGLLERIPFIAPTGESAGGGSASRDPP